ncbi:MAG: ATP-binding protein [Candidatus Paceibacterota bacterium]|jgi:signal transduction histidine kinase
MINSIFKKINAALLLIIFTETLFLVSIVTASLVLQNKYRQINENIVYEQSIKNDIWFLVEDSYNGFKAHDYTNYYDRLNKIKETEKILDSRFALPSANLETKIAYRSVKNSLNAIIKVVEDAKKNWEENGEIIGISNAFQEAGIKFEFVKQNVTDLIFAETDNIARTSQDIDDLQSFWTPVIIGLMILLAAVLITFSFIFSKRITDPLIGLSKIAESIVKGNFKLDVGKDLLERKDEIGTLSNSFHLMLVNLREKITELEISGKELSHKNEELVENNLELDRSKKSITNLLGDIEKEKAKVEETVKVRTHELADEKARLLSSINSLSFGFVMADMNNKIILTNNSLLKILEIPKAPQTISELATYFDKIDLVDSCKRCIQFNQATEIDSAPFEDKFLKIFCAPIVNKDEVIGHVVIIEDISEAKVLERSKEEFFAVASHELRTPLTAIRGNSELMLQIYFDKIVDKDMKEMLVDINSASIRLISIVNEFLEVSKLEQGKIETVKERFDLSTIIDMVIKNIKIIADQKNLKVIYERPNEKLPDVYADKNHTEQILLNLIGNGIKFTNEGEITVKTGLEKGYMKVSVMDTGIGISDQNQQLLFRKFQPAGERILARDVSEGTGLGLYICEQLIKNMGGDIKLEESTLGKGSTFSFTLPLAL